ncbi:peptide chain release factor N(5)-glutamine methyltransferase [Puniceicoccaceae bacterium K14]|nr:peptide chain release factor N(5)-glutamine methyltransferase [Puniceicoccaceae bacterium K14]
MSETLTVLDVIKKSTDFLNGKGIENARFNAEWLIAAALDLDRMQLYMKFDRPLSDQELVDMRSNVVRRGKREPLQYIVGHTQFHDLQLKVDPRVLIPRPETEQLVELIKDSYMDSAPPARILDLGTGSGAIALGLAQIFPESVVVAVDASKEALEVAKENTSGNDLTTRVTLVLSSWYEQIDESERFDLIVSNPPYLTAEEMDTAEPEVKGHEPLNALVSAEAGMRDLFEIISGAKMRLNLGGSLWLETGIAQRQALLGSCSSAGFSNCEGIDDWSGRERFIRAQ